jgi:ribonucleotide reductase beta subunit family protein with ferritin-like domain
MKVFKRPEIRRMASLFSGVEYNSHAPFYNRINEVLFIDTPEFYSSWMDYDYLKERMEFIEEIVSNKDDLISTGGFTFVEGAILYSSFSYLKHFQVQSCGKNLITNICRGIDLTVADENTHAVGSALLFNTIKKERKLNEQQNSYLESVMKDIGLKAYEHESHIINNIFSQGEIGGISIRNMKDFVKHRINLCLNMLGYDDIFPNEELDGSIASWFYANINSTNFHDFFTGSGSSYHIEWKKDLFGNVWG